VTKQTARHEPTEAAMTTAPGAMQEPPLEEQIRVRAYEIYLERGMTDGNELDDWLLAEQEIRERAPKALGKAA
jgi:Protein of unknown function (DUF2934)